MFKVGDKVVLANPPSGFSDWKGLTGVVLESTNYLGDIYIKPDTPRPDMNSRYEFFWAATDFELAVPLSDVIANNYTIED